MALKEVIPCPICGQEKCYEGICWICKAEQERQSVVNMTNAQEQAEINKLLHHLEHINEYEERFLQLVNYRDINTEAFAQIAVEKGIYFPYLLYKNASLEVVSQLCELLYQDDLDALVANQILLCVSVAAAQEQVRPLVYDCLVKLHQEPRAWRAKLHANPNEYAVYGGWSYDQDFNFITTQYPVCYSIVKGTPEQHEHSPVKIVQASEDGERCQVCYAKLFEVIRIDGRDPRLAFLNIDGVIAIKCCLSCFYYEADYFVSYDLAGHSKLYQEFKAEGDATCSIEDSQYEQYTKNTYILGALP